MATNSPLKSNLSPQRLALLSLGLSLGSLVVYVSLIEALSQAGFVSVTAGVLLAAVLSLVLGGMARRRLVAGDAKSKSLLVTLSIAVSLAYLLAAGIIAINVIVQWLI